MSAVRRSRGAPPPAVASNVFAFDAARIHAALQTRARYRYVKPRVVREGRGWKIVSPNCSRNIDPEGGEIDIAWFEPQPRGRWLVHARDHGQAAWRPLCGAATLASALDLVCADDDRVFWP